MIARPLAILGVLCGLACSGSLPTQNHESVTVDGPLRLVVSDAPARMGIFFARARATVSPSTVTVTRTRYGSVCELDVTGHADVTASTIVLHVTYVERLTSCIAEVRALTYRAEVSGLAKGPYDLTVIHEENGVRSTELSERVVVP